MLCVAFDLRADISAAVRLIRTVKRTCVLRQNGTHLLHQYRVMFKNSADCFHVPVCDHTCKSD
jgi:hypothetical protein